MVFQLPFRPRRALTLQWSFNLVCEVALMLPIVDQFCLRIVFSNQSAKNLHAEEPEPRQWGEHMSFSNNISERLFINLAYTAIVVTYIHYIIHLVSNMRSNPIIQRHRYTATSNRTTGFETIYNSGLKVRKTNNSDSLVERMKFCKHIAKNEYTPKPNF